MRLIDFYCRLTGWNIPERIYRQLLKGAHPSLMWDNGVIKENSSPIEGDPDRRYAKLITPCVADYYDPLDKPFKKPSMNNQYAACQHVQRAYDCDCFSPMSCYLCHQRCLDKYDKGELQRKNAKKLGIAS